MSGHRGKVCEVLVVSVGRRAGVVHFDKGHRRTVVSGQSTCVQASEFGIGEQVGSADG